MESKITETSFRPSGEGKHPFYDYEPVTESTKKCRMVPERRFTPWSILNDPHGALTPGTIYNVVKFEVRSWHTRVFLEGVDGCFNNLDLEAVE